MMEIEGLTKVDVYNVMRELLYTVNYAYSKMEKLLKEKYPEELESREFHEVQEKTGVYEARRLSKILDTSDESIDDLIRLVRHSHWAVFENIEVEKMTKTSFRMRTIQCSWQEAMGRKEADCYDCRFTGHLLRSGFFRQANNNAKVQRMFSPPENRPNGVPNNVSCEWLISIE